MRFNLQWFAELSNLLERISPGDGHLSHVLKVADCRETGLVIHSDVASQKMVCYLKAKKTN